jgi:hypothetical protein
MSKPTLTIAAPPVCYLPVLPAPVRAQVVCDQAVREWSWLIEPGNTPLGFPEVSPTGMLAQFKADSYGTYVLTMRARTDEGWSDPVSQVIEIAREQPAPPPAPVFEPLPVVPELDIDHTEARPSPPAVPAVPVTTLDDSAQPLPQRKSELGSPFGRRRLK